MTTYGTRSPYCGSSLGSFSIRLVAMSAPGGAAPLSEYVPSLTSLCEAEVLH